MEFCNQRRITNLLNACRALALTLTAFASAATVLVEIVYQLVMTPLPLGFCGANPASSLK